MLSLALFLFAGAFAFLFTRFASAAIRACGITCDGSFDIYVALDLILCSKGSSLPTPTRSRSFLLPLPIFLFFANALNCVTADLSPALRSSPILLARVTRGTFSGVYHPPNPPRTFSSREFARVDLPSREITAQLI